MALTGTANSKVVHDIKSNLNIRDCVFLEQSHNRVNLRYLVQPKTKEVGSDIARWIQQYHPRDCGVIYCLSRTDCETFAENLRNNHNIRAQHYHAGMSNDDRARRLREWMTGEYKVIVATVCDFVSRSRFIISHSYDRLPLAWA
jgi:superfamily II DNA helicase RecQ